MDPQLTVPINPFGVGITLLMCLLMIALPRRWALAPVIFLICFMTMAQTITVANLNFTMIRILVVFACARLVLRGELRGATWSALDKVMVVWLLFTIVNYTISRGTWDAFVNRLGVAYNVVGTYFVFRFLIQKMEDVKNVIRITAFLIIPLALAMGIEYSTQRNVFSVFGGVSAETVVRAGNLRCSGPFLHPILAGTFGATLFSLFVGLWQQGKGNRLLAGLAILSSTVIIVTSGSSGPILSFLAAVCALAMWSIRKWMRAIRWGVVLAIVALDMVMKAPVWFLIARVDILSGSTGYHRAALIDNAVNHFSEWWVVGSPRTGHWGFGMTDITNQYVLQGLSGGLITLILFVAIIGVSFRAIGGTMAASKTGSPADQRLLWAMGASLFCHAVSFISVDYFDQNFVNWYILLAMVGAATRPSLAKQSSRMIMPESAPLPPKRAFDSLPTQGRSSDRAMRGR